MGGHFCAKNNLSMVGKKITTIMDGATGARDRASELASKSA